VTQIKISNGIINRFRIIPHSPLKAKQSHYRPGQDFRRFRLPDFKTIGI
jgi:hypothetical protein